MDVNGHLIICDHQIIRSKLAILVKIQFALHERNFRIPVKKCPQFERARSIYLYGFLELLVINVDEAIIRQCLKSYEHTANCDCDNFGDLSSKANNERVGYSSAAMTAFVLQCDENVSNLKHNNI